MATPRNRVEHRFRILDDGQDQLFLRRLLLKLVPYGSDPTKPKGKITVPRARAERTSRSPYSRS